MAQMAHHQGNGAFPIPTTQPSEGVIIVDRIGRVRFIDSSAGLMLNVDVETAHGKHLAELPGGVELCEDAGDAGRRIQLNALTPDERLLRVSVSPIHANGESGDKLGDVFVLRDVTHEVTDRLAFVSMLLHDVRSPLTAIRACTDLLLYDAGGPLTDNQRDMLRVAQRKSQALVDLLSNLLDLARIDAGSAPPEWETLDIGDVVREAARVVEEEVAERRVAMFVNLPGRRLPARINRYCFGRALHVFLSSACAHTPPEGYVEVSVDDDGGHIRVTIRESSAESRVHTTALAKHSTSAPHLEGSAGMNLAIAKGFIELHGGACWLGGESSGPLFSFTLPLVEAEAEAGASSPLM
jgi:signal transduction histidine kinase